MLGYETHIRVSYKDTDCMGFVHHSNYLVYYETARTEMLRSYGLVYSELERKGVVSPIISAELKYIRPARYDENLRVVVMTDFVTAARLGLKYEVYDEQGILINTGKTVSAFVSRETHRPVPIPESLLDMASKE